MSVNLKFLKEKMKGSDRDVSTDGTVVLRVYLSRTFPFILLTSNRMVFLCNLKILYIHS